MEISDQRLDGGVPNPMLRTGWAAPGSGSELAKVLIRQEIDRVLS